MGPLWMIWVKELFLSEVEWSLEFTTILQCYRWPCIGLIAKTNAKVSIDASVSDSDEWWMFETRCHNGGQNFHSIAGSLSSTEVELNLP